MQARAAASKRHRGASQRPWPSRSIFGSKCIFCFDFSGGRAMRGEARDVDVAEDVKAGYIGIAFFF